MDGTPQNPGETYLPGFFGSESVIVDTENGVDTDDLNDGVNKKGRKISNDLHYSIEGYKIGTHPGQFNAALANVSNAGLPTTFTHPQNTSVPSDLTGYYEWSPDLSNWYGSGEGPNGGGIVIFTADTTGSHTTVTATASGSFDHCFFRAGVVQK